MVGVAFTLACGAVVFGITNTNRRLSEASAWSLLYGGSAVWVILAWVVLRHLIGV